MIYIFAVKTKNPKIAIHTIVANDLKDAQDKAKAIICNSISLDNMDYEFIMNSKDWNKIIKRMSELKKPISNVEYLTD